MSYEMGDFFFILVNVYLQSKPSRERERELMLTLEYRENGEERYQPDPKCKNPGVQQRSRSLLLNLCFYGVRQVLPYIQTQGQDMGQYLSHAHTQENIHSLLHML